MRKLLTVAVLGLISSLAYAEDSTPVSSPENRQEFDFKCQFRGPVINAEGVEAAETNNNLQCWAWGKFCKDRNNDPTAANECRHDALKIKCNNGFELEDRNPAVEFARDTLWINGDERWHLGTIRVDDFFRRHDVNSSEVTDDREFWRKADLLIAARSGAARLVGKCEFERERDHRP